MANQKAAEDVYVKEKEKAQRQEELEDQVRLRQVFPSSHCKELEPLLFIPGKVRTVIIFGMLLCEIIPVLSSV